MRSFISFLAIIFGVITLKSGAFALFGGEAGREFAGNYIGFILWFNFISGFFYILAGIGIFFKTKWSKRLAKALALLTILFFASFGLYIMQEQVKFEIRTVAAMSIRSTFWLAVFFYLRRERKNSQLS